MDFKYREIPEKLGKVAVNNNIYPKPFIVGSEITILSEPYQCEFNGISYFEVAIECSNNIACITITLMLSINSKKRLLKHIALRTKLALVLTSVLLKCAK